MLTFCFALDFELKYIESHAFAAHKRPVKIIDFCFDNIAGPFYFLEDFRILCC